MWPSSHGTIKELIRLGNFYQHKLRVCRRWLASVLKASRLGRATENFAGSNYRVQSDGENMEDLTAMIRRADSLGRQSQVN